jgi:hypothetical protein
MGNGATSQSNRYRSVRRDPTTAVEKHGQATVEKAALTALGLLGHRIGGRAVLHLKVDEPLNRLAGGGCVEGEAGRRLGVVDEVSPVLPDEGRDTKDRDLGAHPILIDPSVAIDVAGERSGGTQKVVPGPSVSRLGNAGATKEVAIVVHHQA